VQADAACDLVRSTGAFDDIRTCADLTGRARMVVARRNRVANPVPTPVGTDGPARADVVGDSHA
jgi:release factor glutamine methyltransferase